MNTYRTVRALVMIALIVVVMTILGVSSLFRHHSSSGSAIQVSDARDLCTNAHAVLGKAPAYKSGSTPFATALYEQSTTSAGKTYAGVYSLSLPPVGSTVHDDFVAVSTDLYNTYNDQKTPELVGCIDRVSQKATSQNCTYSDGKVVPVYDASYKLTVYQAKTRHRVTSISIPSNPAFTCQSFAPYNGTQFYHAWDQASVVNALKPLIQ